MISSFKCVSSGRKKPVLQVKMLQQDTVSDAYYVLMITHCQEQTLPRSASVKILPLLSKINFQLFTELQEKD